MKKALFFLVVVGLGLAGVAYYTQYRNGRSTEEKYPHLPVGHGNMRDVISVSAVLRPLDVKSIFSMISGQVVVLNPNFGQQVQEGDLLVKLDPREAVLKHNEANTALLAAEAAKEVAESKQAEAKIVRDAAKKLQGELKQTTSGPVDRIKAQGALDIAEATVRTAASAIRGAEANVERACAELRKAEYGVKLTTINVPRFEYANDKAKNPGIGGVQFDGASQRPKRTFTVLDRKVELGQNVDAKQPLYVLAANLEDMRAHALIPESQIGRVAVGQKAVFWVDALGEDKKLPAEVEEIRLMPATQQGAIHYEVLLSVKNLKSPKTGQWQLMPGMTAQVEITDRIHHDTWKLPVNARSFTLEDAYQTEAAKAHALDVERNLADKNADMTQWSKIWIVGTDNKPWPVFVRLGGNNAAGDSGIRDAEYYEILEWDPSIQAELNPKDMANYPKIIIGVPPRESFLKLPNIKL